MEDENKMPKFARQNQLSPTQLLQVFLDEMTCSVTFKMIGEAQNPCHFMFEDAEFYVYVKNLSSAYFPNRDVSRAQLTSASALLQIKATDASFVLLGYDADNQVFATWNPRVVKQRIGTAKSPSLYSRFSWQKGARIHGDFISKDLKNDGTVLLFPRGNVRSFFGNISKFFPDTLDYETEFTDERGILTRIANPKLIDLLRKDLDTEYPCQCAAYATVEDFYGDRFPSMEMHHWMTLFGKIDWDNPYLPFEGMK